MFVSCRFDKCASPTIKLLLLYTANIKGFRKGILQLKRVFESTKTFILRGNPIPMSFYKTLLLFTVGIFYRPMGAVIQKKTSCISR